ncbi:MAG: hypothetical protein ACRD39_05205, partial [Nitrososphaeraceae archaeon]
MVTGTANTAGFFFTITTSVSGGTGTISNATTTPNNIGISSFSAFRADEEGLFMISRISSSSGLTLLFKLSADDGSELFCRRIKSANPEQTFNSVDPVNDGARLLLCGNSTG